VSLHDLHTIIHLRIEEILEMIRAELEKQGLLHLLGSRVVLVGGGSFLKNVDILAQKVFGMPCMLGKPFNVSGLAVVTDGPQYAAPVGMLRYGVSTYEKEAAAGVLKSLFQSLFRK
jgi:cell division protein FtsA